MLPGPVSTSEAFEQLETHVTGAGEERRRDAGTNRAGAIAAKRA
jgi:hypothetical protein